MCCLYKRFLVHRRLFGTFEFQWIGSKRALTDWEEVRGLCAVAAPCCWAGWRWPVTSPACFLILGCAVRSAGHQLVPAWAFRYGCCSCAAASCFCAAVAQLWRCVSPRLLRCCRPARQLILVLLPLAQSYLPCVRKDAGLCGVQQRVRPAVVQGSCGGGAGLQGHR